MVIILKATRGAEVIWAAQEAFHKGRWSKTPKASQMMELLWFWGGPPNSVCYKWQESGLPMLADELLRSLGQITWFLFSSVSPAARWRRKWQKTKQTCSGVKMPENAGSSPHILKSLVSSAGAAWAYWINPDITTLISLSSMKWSPLRITFTNTFIWQAMVLLSSSYGISYLMLAKSENCLNTWLTTSKCLSPTEAKGLWLAEHLI